MEVRGERVLEVVRRRVVKRRRLGEVRVVKRRRLGEVVELGVEVVRVVERCRLGRVGEGGGRRRIGRRRRRSRERRRVARVLGGGRRWRRRRGVEEFLNVEGLWIRLIRIWIWIARRRHGNGYRD